MNFAPIGWALCNGQLLPINQNQALYALLGTSFGGDGVTNFALPNLQGRVPLHVENADSRGQTGGEETHKLTVNEMPAHTHQANAGSDFPSATAAGNIWGGNAITNYAPTANDSMSPNALASSGGDQAHPNMQPYLVLNYCIALEGIFPSRN